MTEPNPPGRPDGRPPTGSAGDRQPVERGGLLALFLGLAGIVLALEMMSLIVQAPPLVVLAPIAGIAAIVLGIRARRRARANARRAPGSVGGITFGIIGLVFSALLLTSLSLFWNEFSTYRDCISGANTIAAQKSCRQTFVNQLSKRSGVPPGELPGFGPS